MFCFSRGLWVIKHVAKVASVCSGNTCVACVMRPPKSRAYDHLINLSYRMSISTSSHSAFGKDRHED